LVSCQGFHREKVLKNHPNGPQNEEATLSEWLSDSYVLEKHHDDGDAGPQRSLCEGHRSQGDWGSVPPPSDPSTPLNPLPAGYAHAGVHKVQH